MANCLEAMDIDEIENDFDDKENAYHHSNVLPRTPCTEKGYEELDVSELNMKLRYSINPMSKSYTVHDKHDLANDQHTVNENNLTRSLNLNITKSDCATKPPKLLPLQALSNDQYVDGIRNTALKPLYSSDNQLGGDVTVTVTEANDLDENIFPSSSSSNTHTPEATTPTKDMPKDGGSPIMRGLKSVLNMFRPSQSPISSPETKPEQEVLSPINVSSHNITETASDALLASTPIAPKRNKENSRKDSPHKDSITFNDDLERELQWKDETTIIFSQEKIPVHKLFFQKTAPAAQDMPNKNINFKLDITEHMEISFNDTVGKDQTLTDVTFEDAHVSEDNIVGESDSEFLDCETTFTKNKSEIFEDGTQLASASKVAKEIAVSSEHLYAIQTLTVTNILEASQKQVNVDNNLREDLVNTNIIQTMLPVCAPETNAVNIELNDEMNENLATCLGLVNIVNTGLSVSISDNTGIENTDMKVVIEKSELNDEVNGNLPNLQELGLTAGVLDHTGIENAGTAEVVEKKENLQKTDMKTDKTLANMRANRSFSLDSVEEKLNVEDNIPSNNNCQSNQTFTELIMENVVNMSTTILQECDINTTQDIVDAILSFTENKYESELKLSEPKINVGNVSGFKQVADFEQITDFKQDTSDLPTDIPFLEDEDDIDEILTNTLIPEVNTPDIIKDVYEIQFELTSRNENPLIQTQQKCNLKIDSLENVETSVTMEAIDQLKGLKEKNVSETLITEDLTEEMILNNIEFQSLETEQNQNTEAQDVTTGAIDQSLKKESCLLQEIEGLPNNNAVKVFNNNVNYMCTLDIVPDIKGLEGSNVINSGLKETTSVLTDVENQNDVEIACISTKDNILEKNAIGENVKIEDKTKEDESMARKSIPLVQIINENKESDTNPVSEIDENLIQDGNVDEAFEINETDNLDAMNSLEVNSKQNANPSQLIDESKDIKVEEIIISENNSPYVSLSTDKTDLDTVAEVKNIENYAEIENNSRIASPPPLSPAIVSKGYNFDFDNIEDPFATKTKIRLSPPSDVKPIEPLTTKNRNDSKNSRKSQPERKKIAQKKNFNKTFQNVSGFLSHNTPKAEKQAMIENEENIAEGAHASFPETERNNSASVTDMIPTEPKESCENFIENVTAFKTIQPESTSDKLVLESSPKGCDSMFISQISGITKPVQVETNEENVISDETITMTTSGFKNTSSSEQSVYLSAGTSSTEIEFNNVVNLSDIDDINFNPFVTKPKVRLSLPPENNDIPVDTNKVSEIVHTLSCKADNYSKVTVDVPSLVSLNPNETMTLDVEHKELTANMTSSTCSSKDDRDVTVREVHTEDEDTVEGPFLEAEDFNLEEVDHKEQDNMMNFSDLPVQENVDAAEGEMFIDAAAFEFLMNQNNKNKVSVSGKESLFLKFDPLFARRSISDGVMAALSNLQRKQSTPKKNVQKNNFTVEKSPVPETSNVTLQQKAFDESTDDTNTFLSKPMMVVTPAVNPAVTTRKKATTPAETHRRSMTITSPAIAVIDRLLNLSSNSSFASNNTYMQTQEQNEAEIALVELRELLADKEIQVQHLRSESEELKDRLCSLEQQMKILTDENEFRLKKINELNTLLNDKNKLNKSMAAVVEEYERTIATLISEIEQDKKRHEEEKAEIIKDRDEQLAHLSSMEVAFNDLHSKYEKSKQLILAFKANEDAYKNSYESFEANLSKMQSNYEQLKQHATSKLNHANQELEKINKAHEAEVVKLNAMIKRKELHAKSLEETLAQKTKANEELTAICDELINKVG